MLQLEMKPLGNLVLFPLCLEEVEDTLDEAYCLAVTLVNTVAALGYANLYNNACTMVESVNSARDAIDLYRQTCGEFTQLSFGKIPRKKKMEIFRKLRKASGITKETTPANPVPEKAVSASELKRKTFYDF